MKRIETLTREKAFKIRTRRNKRFNVNNWFVGLTTNKYFWLDLEINDFNKVVHFAKIAALRLKTTVYIFQTAKSYHLVTKKIVTREQWDTEYSFWLKQEGVCKMFCECCLKYKKATLRISLKNGNIPQLIAIVTPELSIKMLKTLEVLKT